MNSHPDKSGGQPVPLVTVAMPVYNAGDFLRLAVLSIVRQTFTDWELLIIDDGSTDDALRTIADIDDARIRILRDGKNRGLAARLNECIDLARGVYFARMDQDDVSYPARLARQVALLEADHDLDLVAVRSITIDENNEATGSFPSAFTHDEICATPWRGFHFPHPTWMGRMEWFRKHRYAVPGPYFCEDQELLLRSYRTSRFATIGETLFAYRMRGRIDRKKLARTRRAVLGVQWRHFTGLNHWHLALLALVIYVARTGSDAWMMLRGNVRAGLADADVAEWSKVMDGLAPERGGFMKKLCYVATIPAVVHAFLRAHIVAVAQTHEVTVICNSADRHLLDGLNARLILLPIERKPSLWKDALVLYRLYRLFRRERFDIVHSIMPKTGMLAMQAAWLAQVPVRIHTFTGQVWVTRQGVRRMLLKWFDRRIGSLATRVLADSPSQRDFLVQEGVLSPAKAQVIGAGSICGVDAARFRPDPDVGRATRDELGIAQDASVVLFVGRLNRDKGLLDLASAFTALAQGEPKTVLLLVGAEEDVPFSRLQQICRAERERLRYVSFSATPERYMNAADILCLPSYREGFGQVIIEAAACGVPAVASRIYGITDAVVDGKTGLLFPAGDVAALTQALSKMVAESAMRHQMGEAACARALESFSSGKITRELVMLYERLSDGGGGKNAR